MSGRVLRPPATRIADLFVEALLQDWPPLPARYCVVRLADLAHIVCETEPERLARLRAAFDEQLYEPIRLIKRPGEPLALRNGNHRTTIARERGYDRIGVLILYDGFEL